VSLSTVEREGTLMADVVAPSWPGASGLSLRARLGPSPKRIDGHDRRLAAAVSGTERKDGTGARPADRTTIPGQDCARYLPNDWDSFP
jgi:hypothetical protein